jgi:hypothetical protein
MMAEVLMATVALVLMVLCIDVVSAMPARGAWGAFGMWAGLGLIAPAVAMLWRAQVPLPIAALLLAMVGVLWRFRGRLRWAAQHGRIW